MEMEGVIAGVINTARSLNRLSRKEREDQSQKLISEIDSVKRSLDMVSAKFDYQSDPDLVDECIYEMQALAARYRYLTKEARRQGITKNSLASLQKI